MAKQDFAAFLARLHRFLDGVGGTDKTLMVSLKILYIKSLVYLIRV
jgi:hypothetical protein